MNSLNDIADREWDVLIIGGGIFGAAVARDAALRGLKTALVERTDFASETSSKSTKLIHGGIRYLEQLQLHLVHECLKERTTLLTIAPHLVRPMPFVIPVFQGDRHALSTVKFGTWLYGMLAGKDVLRRSEGLSQSEIIKKYPFLKKTSVKGGVRYFDAQMDDIRLCLETIMSASYEGAQAVNHVEIHRIGVRDDGKFDVGLTDQISKTIGKARALTIVNTAGPWADRVLSMLDPRHKPMLRLSKGIHLVVRQKISNEAITLSSSDKRVIFIIPWKNGSIVGTTDTEYRDSLDDVHANHNEVDFILQEVNRTAKELDIRRSDIVTTFAGIRPLAALHGKSTAKVSRNHLIHETPKGFFSVVGGKYTTHRLIAEQVCNKVERFLRRKHVACKTHELPLWGSFDLPHEPGFTVHLDISGINRHALEQLMRTYGRCVRDVVHIAARNENLRRPICMKHPVIGAQVIYAIEHEFAKNLMDVCVRRLRLDQMSCRGLDCVFQVANLMSDRLDWSTARKQIEIQEFQNWVKKSTVSLS